MKDQNMIFLSSRRHILLLLNSILFKYVVNVARLKKINGTFIKSQLL